MLNFKPRLTWRPDNTQPLPNGQTSFNDALLRDSINKLQSVASTVQTPVQEVNGVLDLRQFCPPVDDQGQLSDCVADATCSSLEFVKIRNGVSYSKLSRLFLYYNARLQVQETNVDQGTYIRLAFSTLATIGTCNESTWTYDQNMVFTRPSWSSYQEAYLNRITSFFTVPQDIVYTGGGLLVNAIKQSLQAQHPVVFGMTVDDAYQQVGPDGVVAMPLLVRQNPGGHCQMICGYDNNKQTWIVQNSWGTGWGDNGFCYCPWTYLDASNANDIWTPYMQGSTP
jgi:C1A family cysteine protease